MFAEFQLVKIYLKLSCFKGPLHSHTAVIYQNKMYIYGGKNGTFTNKNDLFALDFEKY